MEMTNMQADMILGQLNTIYAFLMKNSELVPCTLSAGLAKNIRKIQEELKEYFKKNANSYRNMISLLMPRSIAQRTDRNS